MLFDQAPVGSRHDDRDGEKAVFSVGMYLPRGMIIHTTQIDATFKLKVVIGNDFYKMDEFLHYVCENSQASDIQTDTPTSIVVLFYNSFLSDMASYLITGASRGLGLAMAQGLLSKPASKVAVVFVIARQITPALEGLAHTYPQRLVILLADVTDEKSIQKAALQVESTLNGPGLDFLINNAGTFPFSDGIEMMYEATLCKFLPDILG